MVKALGLLMALLMVLSACGGGTIHSDKLATDQTLKFPIFDELHTLDPGRLEADTDGEISQNLFDGLLRFDNQGVIQPDIATSLPKLSADGLTYLFHLRSDVHFWNGDRVTAKDVLYSWNRAANLQGPYATTFAPVKGYDQMTGNGKVDQSQLQQLLIKGDSSVSMSGLTAPDGLLGYTVQVKLSHPSGWFLSGLALQPVVGMILDAKAVGSDPLNWWQNPQNLVGTGAYRLVQHVPKQSYDFQAVANWWGSPKPTVQHVHLDLLADLHTGIAAYEQGKYDLVGYGGYENFPLGEVQRICNAAGQYVLSRDGWQAVYNHPQDWFDYLWGSKLGCPDTSCTSGYTSPAYDALLAKADAEPLVKAVPDYQKLSHLLSQQAVYIPLYYSVGTFLFKSYLEGAGANNVVDYPWDQLKIYQH